MFDFYAISFSGILKVIRQEKKHLIPKIILLFFVLHYILYLLTIAVIRYQFI